jgi:hypothetical protein
MDEALGRKRKDSSVPLEVEASVKALAEKMERLDPIGKPLKPAAPCKPPDMRGGAGGACGDGTELLSKRDRSAR